METTQFLWVQSPLWSPFHKSWKLEDLWFPEPHSLKQGGCNFGISSYFCLLFLGVVHSSFATGTSLYLANNCVYIYIQKSRHPRQKKNITKSFIATPLGWYNFPSSWSNPVQNLPEDNVCGMIIWYRHESGMLDLGKKTLKLTGTQIK